MATLKDLSAQLADIDKRFNDVSVGDEAAGYALLEQREAVKAQLDQARGAARADIGRRVDAGAAAVAPVNGDDAFRGMIRAMEARTMTIGASGTTTLPDVVQTTVAAELVKARDLAGVMRGLCSVVTYPTSTNVNRLSTRNAAAWTAEAASFNASDLDTTAVSFSAYKSTVQTSVSVELVQDSVISVEAELMTEHGRAHGRLQEEGFVAGNGTGKPMGVFNGTWDTNPAAGDGTLTVSDLVTFFYGNLPAAYQSTAVWVMSAANFGTLANNKDTTGQWLLSTSMNNVAVHGAAALVCGRPVYISEYAPSTKIFCGDLGVGYRIADRAGFTWQVDPYSSGSTGYVTFRSFARTDGRIIEPGAGAIYTI